MKFSILHIRFYGLFMHDWYNRLMIETAGVNKANCKGAVISFWEKCKMKDDQSQMPHFLKG